MHDNVQPVPVFAQAGKHGLDLLVTGDIAGKHDPGIDLAGEFLDPLFELIILIAESQFSALPVHGFGDTPGDGAIARNADNQRTFACQKTHVLFLPLVFTVT